MRWLLILLIAIATSACETAPPAPPSGSAPLGVNVSGNWAGTWSAFEGSGGKGEMKGRFAQEGATVRGDFEVRGPQQMNHTYVSGTVVGNELRLLAPSPGTLVVNGDEMTGTVSGLMTIQVILRKQP